MANASAEIYREPIAELSQGDIVEISPHTYLDPPLRSVHEPTPGAVTIRPIAVEDLKAKSDVVARCSPHKALIINYDCEIAKPHILRLVTCPIVPLSDLPPSEQGHAKR